MITTSCRNSETLNYHDSFNCNLLSYIVNKKVNEDPSAFDLKGTQKDTDLVCPRLPRVKTLPTPIKKKGPNPVGLGPYLDYFDPAREVRFSFLLY